MAYLMSGKGGQMMLNAYRNYYGHPKYSKFKKRSYNKAYVPGKNYIMAKRKGNISKTKLNKKRINYLGKKISNNEADIDFRTIESLSTRTAGTNQCKYFSVDGSSKSLIEDSIKELKFFNPASPGTLITTNYNTGTFQKQIMIRSSGSINLRNNYKVPITLKLYICKIKADTSLSPFDCITSGFVDIGSLAVTDVMSKASDSLILKDLWHYKKICDKLMQPGTEVTYKHYGKSYSYDTSLVDTHNLTYVKQFKVYSWLLRIGGVLAHDSVDVGDEGLQNSAIDIIIRRNHHIIYDAGVDLNEVQTDPTLNSFQNTANTTVLDHDQAEFGL